MPTTAWTLVSGSRFCEITQYGEYADCARSLIHDQAASAMACEVRAEASMHVVTPMFNLEAGYTNYVVLISTTDPAQYTYFHGTEGPNGLSLLLGDRLVWSSSGGEFVICSTPILWCQQIAFLYNHKKLAPTKWPWGVY